MMRSHRHARFALVYVAFALSLGGASLAWSQDDPTAPAPIAKKTKKKGDENTSVIAGRLTSKDPIDKERRNTYAQIHKVKLKAGLEYVIDLQNTNSAESWDPYLRLEDPTGKKLFEDDDGAGYPNSRIVYSPPVDGEYRLVVMSLGGPQEGSFQLVVAGRPPGLPPPAPGTPIFNIQNPTDFGDIIVTPAAQPVFLNGGSERLSHGYIEYRFEIANDSPKNGHRVTLTLPPSRRGYGGHWGPHLRSISKTVEVAPESTVNVSLFQPDVPINFGNVGVDIDGNSQEREVQVNVKRNQNMSGRYGYGGGGPVTDSRMSILASADVAGSVRGNIYKSAVGEPATAMGGSSTSGIFMEKGSPHDGKHFNYSIIHGIYQADSEAFATRSWLGFSPYDGLVLSGRSLDAMAAETRAAVWQYVECGGTLVVAGKGKLPESWRFAKTKLAGCSAATPGFGKCLVFDNANLAAWSPDDWKLIAQMWSQSRGAWDQITSVTDANANFPVVENLGIPIRGLFTAMFLFVIVIGPLNIFWLSRTNRRLWLLWTVPAISLLTTGLLFTYMGFSEGWHAHVRALAITVLDENSQRASSIGCLGYYSPTTARGLRFSADTEISPHVQVDHRRYRGGAGPSFTIDWTEDQHLDSGWITPKVPLHMLVRRGEKRLERLSVRRDGGQIVVVNGLKADIQKLQYADKEGVIYTAEAIPAGAESKLTRSNETVAAKTPLHDKFGSTTSWRNLAEMMKTSPNEYLNPGTYIAVLDDLPFLEQGLKDTQSRRMQSVVYGISKDAP